LYCIARRNAREALYVAQSDERKVFGGMLGLEFEKGTGFGVVKQFVGKNRVIVGAGCVQGSDGKLVTSEAEVKDRWKASFDILLNGEFEWNKDGLTAVNTVCGPAEIISCIEVKCAFTKTQVR
jgi:hypothetical protein